MQEEDLINRGLLPHKKPLDFIHLRFDPDETIAYDTLTSVIWNIVVFQSGGFSLSSDGTKVAVPKNGVYSIVFIFQFASAAGGIRQGQMRTDQLGSINSYRSATIVSDPVVGSVAMIAYLKAGDAIYGQVYQNQTSAGTLALRGVTNGTCGLAINLIQEL